MRSVRNPITMNEVAIIGLFGGFGLGMIVDSLKRAKEESLTRKLFDKIDKKGLREKLEDVELEKGGMLLRDLERYGYNDPRLREKKIALILLLEEKGGVFVRKNTKSGRMYIDGYELPKQMNAQQVLAY